MHNTCNKSCVIAFYSAAISSNAKWQLVLTPNLGLLDIAAQGPFLAISTSAEKQLDLRSLMYEYLPY